MRIGIDSHAAERDGTGNCTYIRNLLLQLADLDTKNDYILFVTDRNHPFYKKLEDRPNFEIVQIRRSPAWLRVFFALPSATHRKKIDILHVQYFAPPGHRGRLINTVHDITPFRFPQFFSRYERLLFRFLLPHSLRKASFILTGSSVCKEDFVTLMQTPANKIKVAYNGVDENLSLPHKKETIQSVRSLYGLTGKFLLYVGRIDPRKNLIRLIQAYAYLRKNHSLNLKLAIVGKTDLKPNFLQQTLSDCEYRNDIRFCGFVPDEHLPALYKAAEVFVYTSEYEGFGLPPLEAMASGTPVVASDISIFREILSDAAVLVNPRDILSIADGIYRAVTDQELRKSLIEKGDDQVKKYSWKETALITLRTYEEAFNHRL